MPWSTSPHPPSEKGSGTPPTAPRKAACSLGERSGNPREGSGRQPGFFHEDKSRPDYVSHFKTRQKLRPHLELPLQVSQPTAQADPLGSWKLWWPFARGRIGSLQHAWALGQTWALLFRLGGPKGPPGLLGDPSPTGKRGKSPAESFGVQREQEQPLQWRPEERETCRGDAPATVSEASSILVLQCPCSQSRCPRCEL